MRKSLFILFVALALLIAATTIEAKNNRRRSQDANEFDDDDEFSEFDNSDEESNAREAAGGGKKQSQQETKKQPEPVASNQQGEDGFDELIEDEFEETEIKKEQPIKKDEKPSSSVKHQQQASQQSVDDLDMEEFEHFVDDEEFENFDGKPAAKSDKSKPKSVKTEDTKMPNLKITNVPTHLLSVNNWHNYVWEIVALVLIAIYFINFIYGKSKNYKFVKAWIGSHYDILEKNFALVGDNGTAVEIAPTNPSEPIDLTTKLIKGKLLPLHTL